MQIYNPEKAGKITSTRVHIADRRTAGIFLVFSIFLLLLAHDIKAETGVGMINRAPLVKTIAEPTELDKIATDLDGIIKSINDIPDEVEDNIAITEPVIASPEKVTPVKVMTDTKVTEKKPAKPVLAKPEKSVATNLKTAEEKPVPPSPITSSTRGAYLKLASNGAVLKNSTTIWACVEDIKSGLVWEVKSNNDGIRDKDHLYSWFDPSQAGGVTDGGRCKGNISCDTYAYVQAMNKQKLCGHDDWRLPTREEMQSLIYFDNENTKTRINNKYFPEAMASWYWTASSNEDNPSYAWYVLFRNGISLNDLKERPKHIRLVRTDKKV